MKWILVKTISCTKSEWVSHLEHKYGPQPIPPFSSNKDVTNLENHFVIFWLYKSIHSLKTVDLFFDCSQKQALKKHISEIHEEGKKLFKCDICDQSFSQKFTILKYGFCKKLTLVQMNLWPVEHFFSADPAKKWGKKVFNWSEVHLYWSNFLQNPYSNKSFKCDICDHNFSQKANLKIHIAEIYEVKKYLSVIYASTVVPKSKLWENIFQKCMK
jgi:hypothetical protein